MNALLLAPFFAPEPDQKRAQLGPERPWWLPQPRPEPVPFVISPYWLIVLAEEWLTPEQIAEAWQREEDKARREWQSDRRRGA